MKQMIDIILDSNLLYGIHSGCPMFVGWMVGDCVVWMNSFTCKRKVFAYSEIWYVALIFLIFFAKYLYWLLLSFWKNMHASYPNVRLFRHTYSMLMRARLPHILAAAAATLLSSSHHSHQPANILPWNRYFARTCKHNLPHTILWVKSVHWLLSFHLFVAHAVPFLLLLLFFFFFLFFLFYFSIYTWILPVQHSRAMQIECYVKMKDTK